MITLNFYSLTEDPRKVSKTPTPAVVGPGAATSLSGTFKDPVDTFEPRVIVELGDSYIHAFNYVRIYEWSKYYFVVDKEILQKGLVRLYLREDVRMTWASAILASSGMVTRTASNLKPFLKDPSRPFSESISRTVIATTNTSHPFNPTFQELLGNYTIVVQCSNVNVANVQKQGQPATPDDFSVLPNESSVGKGGAVNAYVMSVGQLKNFYKLFIDANIAGDFDSFINSLAGNSLQGINSIIAYPFNLVNKGILVRNAGDTGDDNSIPIQIYNHTIAGQTAYELRSNACYTVDFGTFSYTVSSFADLEPYTRASLYLPYVGTVDIPMSWLAGGGINVKYKINMYTGDALVSITSNDVATYVRMESAHIGIHIPLTSSNNVEQARNGAMNLFNGFFGALTNPNPAQGLMTLGKSFMQIGMNTSTISTAPATSEVSRMSKYDPYVLVEKLVDETPANYGDYIGFPYEQIAALNTLSGRCEVSEIFGTFDNATAHEMDEIRRALREGSIF